MSNDVNTPDTVNEPTHVATESSMGTKKPRPKKRRGIILSAVGVAVVAAVVGVLALTPSPGGDTETKKPLTLETKTVTRGPLKEQLRLQGTLGYSQPRTLGTKLDGTLTSMAAPGTVIGNGGELFRINEIPVLLLHGALPAWRDFAPAMSDGADVLQLEQALGALGYLGGKADAHFDSNTKWAIWNWQKAMGVETTGEFKLGRIIFAPTDLRVAGQKAKPGDAAGAEILSMTDTNKVVAVQLETTQQTLAQRDAKVTIVLPGGKETVATVTNVGAPAEVEGTDGKKVKVPVTLTLDDAEAGGTLENVAVTAMFSRVLSPDALLVPVVALLAQPGGGFAVEVLTGTATKLVTVKLGTFADGQVIVTGGELAEGDSVVVAK